MEIILSKKQDLDLVLRQWHTKAHETLAGIEDVPIRKFILSEKPSNMFRMLNWKTWCLREQVDLEFILRTLLNYFQQARRRSTNSLGISIATLTGERSRDIVAMAVAKAFPNQENRLVRENALKIRMCESTLPLKMKTEDQVQNPLVYITKMEQRRKRLVEAQQKFSRRPWRGNPWR